ncbi:hypothetical protein N9L76_04930 [bacterium]|nr:hypothetical protein [bacterium]
MERAVRGARRRGAQGAWGDAARIDCEGMKKIGKRCVHCKPKNTCMESNPCPHGMLKRNCAACKQRKR